MSYFVIPSFIAVVLKLALLWFARKNLARNRSLALTMFALLALNSLELTSFFLLDRNLQDYVWLMQLYYIVVTVLIAALLDLCLVSSGLGRSSFRGANVVFAGLLCVVVAIPGLVIVGVDPMGGLVRRVPGPATPVWSAYNIAVCLLCVGQLWYGRLHSDTWQKRRQCVALNCGLTPLIVVLVVVGTLMAFDVAVNAALMLPLATTAFMVVMVLAETKDGTFQLLSKIPATQEYRARRDLSRLVSEMQQAMTTSGQQVKLKPLLQNIEVASINLALLANEGNKSRTAKALGISNATLHRKKRVDT